LSFARAIQEGSVEENNRKDDVTADREYVGGYVEYLHYVERFYEAAKEGAPLRHYDETAAVAALSTEC
jgi:hypothetical protein